MMWLEDQKLSTHLTSLRSCENHYGCGLLDEFDFFVPASSARSSVSRRSRQTRSGQPDAELWMNDLASRNRYVLDAWAGN